MPTHSKRPDLIELRGDGNIYTDLKKVLATKDSDPLAQAIFCFMCGHPESLDPATRRMVENQKLKDESELKRPCGFWDRFVKRLKLPAVSKLKGTQNAN